MDYIWTPWRYQYMKEAASGNQPECIFCEAVARNNDAETLIVAGPVHATAAEISGMAKHFFRSTECMIPDGCS